MAEKTVAFLVARVGSSRLPGKHFRSIGDRALIKWTIDQLRSCQEIDELVIATGSRSENTALVNLARHEGISCFCYDGPVDHVTTRLCRAAEYHKADICLLISGDCPLIHGPAIDWLLRSFKVAQGSNVLVIDGRDRMYPSALQGVMIARRGAWDLADDLSLSPELKEHQFPVLGLQAHRFIIHYCALPHDLYAPFHRLSVDTWADLEFLNRVYEQLRERQQPFSLPHVLALLQEKKELTRINQHVHQRLLKEDIKRVLVIIDVGAWCGYGQLFPAVEFALQVVERLGWPVTFVVDDSYATGIIEERGLAVIHGALHRTARGGGGCGVAELTGFDVALLDLAPRALPPVWREGLLAGIPILGFENGADWCRDLELLLIPGSVALPPVAAEGVRKAESRPCLSGREVVIIPREVRRAREYMDPKKIDILLDSSGFSLFEATIAEAQSFGICVRTVDCASPEYPRLLAQSLVYIGPFSPRFFDALSLGTLPVLLVDHDTPDLFVSLFYQLFSLPVLHFDPTEGLLQQWQALLKERGPLSGMMLSDSTPQLVAALAGCVTKGLASKGRGQS